MKSIGISFIVLILLFLDIAFIIDYQDNKFDAEKDKQENRIDSINELNNKVNNLIQTRHNQIIKLNKINSRIDTIESYLESNHH